MAEQTMETAMLGGGCFWCIEAVLERLEGVSKVVSGYAGGKSPNPSYERVSSGTTGHAEVVQVEYDPKQASYKGLLDKFWSIHDPTTLDRQGPDIGKQYRSVIFYHTLEQKKIALEERTKMGKSGKFRKTIVTEIAKAGEFWEAEEYHQRYLMKKGLNKCSI